MSYHNKILNVSSRILLIGISLTLFSCIGGFDKENETVEDTALGVTIIEPVKRDYAEIKHSGVLRMITSYSSDSYFLHRGIQSGFEYELVKNFAKENDLALEVIIVG